MTASLPIPDAIAQAHSRALVHKLKQAADQAPLLFSSYMQRCLYEPGLGYYMAGSQKFGAEGDFVTAPEVSPLFGACLAKQCNEVLALTGGDILELGAGSGRLALSVIENLAEDSWGQYLIVEPSADLQERQLALLQNELTAEQFEKVQWLSALPDSFSGVMLANEVMDALPVERVVRTDNGFDVEVIQSVADPLADEEKSLMLGQLCSSELPDSTREQISASLAHIEQDIGFPLPQGYRSELSQLLTPWVRSLADCLHEGVLVLIDYGYPRREYYLEERAQGTLQCFYRHHAHSDVTFWPGLQDITAHVDFTTVVEAGDAAGLELLGYTAQAPFLFGCGLAELATNLSAVWNTCGSDTPANRIQNQQAINRLTLPGEMGERFQVMALGRGVDLPLCGFSVLDLSRRL